VLGHSIVRSEDPALLTGEARFMADLPDGDASLGIGTLHAVFVRSPMAHGTIREVDVAAARTAPGVHSVWTAADLDLPPQKAFGGRPGPERPLLARDRVRFVGDPVAVVLAGSHAAAIDAAEVVAVDLDPVPAVVDPVAAASEGAPLLFPDGEAENGGSNIVGGRHKDADPAFFDGADVVVQARLHHQRLAPVPMEANGCVAVPDGESGEAITVWASTQSVFEVHAGLTSALGLDPDRVRVRAPWIGGGFGAKGGVYPEQIIVAALALRTGHVVRWDETRSENLVAMTHGRAQIHDIEVGATRDGRITALRVRGWADSGAYPVRSLLIPLTTRLMASGAYAIPAIDYQAVTVLTNTTPTGPYRGAGRPEATALSERAIDLVAYELGLDPVEVRRRNFPAPSAFPFTTATGVTYDSGDYATALDEALRLAGYDTWRAEQRRRRDHDDGPLLGIGVACYVEISGLGGEFGSVDVSDDGSVTVVTGSVPHGQGHETAWAQVAASVLGIPLESVRVRHSDTAVVDHGTGTFGSRSLQLGGSAVHEAATEVWGRARQLAAELLEAAADDIVPFGDGRIGVTGVPARAMGWGEVAAEARRRGTPLTHALDFNGESGTFPFGAHVAVVEIDRETGRVGLRRMIAVDDCGRVINPLLAEGQVHGGLAQGIAQVLFEGVSYDEDGNPLTASLLDYLVPSAADLPPFVTAHTETPTPANPLGAKGIGESGTTGSIAAVWNAVVDALQPFGVRHLNPPFTPEAIWRCLSGFEPRRTGHQ
jgi:aerobic carbon-monoxide dehydrogenase large subunit